MRERREDAAREIHDRDAALGRRRVGFARDAHEAGIRLEEIVVSGLPDTRAGPPEARERAADDPRVDRAERRIVEAEFRRKIAAKIVVDGVDARDQAVQEVAGLGGAQVERQASRPAVE